MKLADNPESKLIFQFIFIISVTLADNREIYRRNIRCKTFLLYKLYLFYFGSSLITHK